MAKDVRFLITASADNAVAEMKKMQANGEDVSKLMGYAFQRLGTTSDTAFQKQKDSARTAYELITKSGVASAADIERAHIAMQTKLNGIDKAAAMQGVGRAAKESAADVNVLAGRVDVLTNSIMSLAGPAAMGLLVKTSIAAALATERYTAAMEATAGSSQAAAREIQFVREESNRLGLNFVDTAGAFAKFSASTKNTSIEGEATRKIFVGVSEAVTAMKLSGDEANGIFLALSQMMSKGKISAEELNGQLGERLPGALKLTADAMGMTTGELLKQMEQGKLMSADVLPKLAEQMHKTYGEAAKKSAEGGQAAINRFKNEVKATASAIGTALMPALNKLGNKSADLLKQLRESPPGWLTAAAYAFSPGIAYLIRKGAKDSAAAPVSSQKTDAELSAENAKTDQARVKESAERAKAAGETAKKEMDKQKKEASTAFQEKSRVILDIEKDRVKSLLTIEKEYGARLKDQYRDRVTDLDNFRKAMDTITESRAERDKKRAEELAVALRGPEDSYQKYYRTRAELAQAETELDNDSGWSPESLAKKAKGYDDLIKKAEQQMQQARDNGVENISTEQALFDARLTRERLESKIEELGKRQIGQMETAAILASEGSDAWQARIKATEDQVRVLDQMLQNLPRVKDIDVNLRINGLADLQSIPGVMKNTAATGSGGYSDTDYSEKNLRAQVGAAVYDSWPQAATGTNYVARGGVARIHEGEAIIPKKYNPAAGGTGGGATFTIQGGINFTLPNVTNQSKAADLARDIYPELQKLARR